MVDFFNKGGPFMWPLLVCSVLGLAFVLERFVTFFLARANPKRFVQDLKEAIKKGGVKEAITICEGNRSPVARILSAGLAKSTQIAGSSPNPGGGVHNPQDRDWELEFRRKSDRKTAIEEAITNSGATELAFLDRGMWVLASITNIAPLIGFLGTVSGMIRAFEAIASFGEVDAAIVATGISEALITTATGLAIAFPIVFFHSFFTSRISGYTRNMEEASNDLVEYLVEQGE
ncbi:MotA/TolQ/ExbB proton channel family protein [candidate division TA06 bacterium]|nr:MotA/TolQ/ExbB proton channel family protein [candidate division TA06 bacterium]